MTIPTHIIAGLIIGKATGDYTTSILAASLVDFDHVISYAKNGLMQKPEKLWETMTREEDLYGDQRGYLHNIFSFLALTIIAVLINTQVGIVFSLGYLSHLILDAMDKSDFWPLYPMKNFRIRGFIKYFSYQELIFAAILVVVFFLI